MGAGKTTVGRLVARRLGWRYSDSDDMVEASTGHTVAELWEAGGEPRFRREEARVLAEALAGDEQAVVAVAGGAVLDPANRALLRRSGTVVWLRAAVPTLVRRVGAGRDHRPLLAGDPAGNLARLDEVRRPLYAEVADAVVDVDGLRPDAVAAEVLAVLGAVAPRRASHGPTPGDALAGGRAAAP